MDNVSAPAATPAPKKSFLRKPLGCLLSLFVGGLLFLVLVLCFALWFAGSNHALDQASKFFNQKSGGALTFAENDNNFFAGRVHLKGVEISNPSRFTDKQCFKLNELHAEVKPLSALGERVEIPVVTVDIGSVSLVGAEKWREDNNLLDFKKAFVPESGEQPKAEEKPAAEGPKKHFHIGKLVLRMDKIRVVSNATTPGTDPKLIAEESAGLNWEFTDVTDENLVEKVWPVVKKDILGLSKFVAKLAAAIGKEEAKALLQNAGVEATSAVNDILKSGAGSVIEAVSGVSGQAGEVVSGAATKATDALGGLFKKKK